MVLVTKKESHIVLDGILETSGIIVDNVDASYHESGHTRSEMLNVREAKNYYDKIFNSKLGRIAKLQCYVQGKHSAISRVEYSA
jgi:hypothetical protein